MHFLSAAAPPPFPPLSDAVSMSVELLHPLSLRVGLGRREEEEGHVPLQCELMARDSAS